MFGVDKGNGERGIASKCLRALIIPSKFSVAREVLWLASLRSSSKLVAEFVERDSNPPIPYKEVPLPINKKPHPLSGSGVLFMAVREGFTAIS